MKNIVFVILIFLLTAFVLILGPKELKPVQIGQTDYAVQNNEIKSTEKEIKTQAPELKKETRNLQVENNKSVSSREEYMENIRNRAKTEFTNSDSEFYYENQEATIPDTPPATQEKTAAPNRQFCGNVCLIYQDGTKKCEEIPCSKESTTDKTDKPEVKPKETTKTSSSEKTVTNTNKTNTSNTSQSKTTKKTNTKKSSKTRNYCSPKCITLKKNRAYANSSCFVYKPCKNCPEQIMPIYVIWGEAHKCGYKELNTLYVNEW